MIERWMRTVNLTDEIRPEVLRGAEWLDNQVLDWERRIDLDALNLESEVDCILGQLFGNFFKALQNKGLPFQWANDHGFLPRLFTGIPNNYREDIKTLDTSWRRLILRRLNK